MSRDSSLVSRVGELVTKPAGVATDWYERLVCRYYITINRLMQHRCVFVYMWDLRCNVFLQLTWTVKIPLKPASRS